MKVNRSKWIRDTKFVAKKAGNCIFNNTNIQNFIWDMYQDPLKFSDPSGPQ